MILLKLKLNFEESA